MKKFSHVMSKSLQKRFRAILVGGFLSLAVIEAKANVSITAAAINHGDFLIHGFHNRDLQRLRYCTPATSDTECRRRSATISRKLGLLKAHGLIRKIQHTHRYQVSKEGQTILVAVLTTARTTLQQINQLQVAA